MSLDICDLEEAQTLGQSMDQVITLVNYGTKVPRFHKPQHLVLYMDDVADDSGYPSPQYYHVKTALDFIKSFSGKDQKVLIHCFAGISRSTALALGAAFLVKDIKAKTADEALLAVLARRQEAWPNNRIVQFVDKYFKLDGELVDAVRQWKGSVT